MHLLDAWHESNLYSARERAALAWAESLTNIATTHAPDHVYDEAWRQFSEKELADLSTVIVMIDQCLEPPGHQCEVGSPGRPSKRRMTGPYESSDGTKNAVWGLVSFVEASPSIHSLGARIGYRAWLVMSHGASTRTARNTTI
jgi:hypothetical protein